MWEMLVACIGSTCTKQEEVKIQSVLEKSSASLAAEPVLSTIDAERRSQAPSLGFAPADGCGYLHSSFNVAKS
jgi:hypothetical protein